LKTALKVACAKLFLLARTALTLLVIIGFSKKRNFTRFRKRPHAIVLGNGPSLAADVGLIAERNLRDQADVWAVNNFCLSSEFLVLKPDYYVLADPNFWLSHVSPEVFSMRQAFLTKINSVVDWSMELLLPYDALGSDFVKGIVSDKIAIKYFNRTPLSGLDVVVFKCWDLNLGMPPALNVLIAALSLAVNSSYSKLLILGADHSWHEELSTSDDGTTVVKQKHFYDSNVNAAPVVRPDTSAFSIGDLFVRWGEVFKTYELIERYAKFKRCKIINVSSKTYIDAFERRALRSICW